MVSKMKGGFNFLPKPFWVVHRWSKNAHIQGENSPHRCRKVNKKGQNYTHIVIEFSFLNRNQLCNYNSDNDVPFWKTEFMTGQKPIEMCGEHF